MTASPSASSLAPSPQKHETPSHDTQSHDTPMLRIAQISDVHLKPDDPRRQQRFEDILQLAIDQKPDRIVLSGDLTEDGFDRPDELRWAKAILDTTGIDLLLIPGNHDVGDKPGAGPNAIDADRLRHWCDVFGQDHFIHDVAHWRLVGLNSLLVGSGLPEEEAQLRRLDDALALADRLDLYVAIFLHELPFLGQPGAELGNRSDYWAIAPDKQPTYLERFDHLRVRLVANGHVHWHHAFRRGRALHAWCPSSAFIVDDPNFPRGGQVAGLLVYELTADRATHQLIRYDQPDTQVIHFAESDSRRD